MKTPTTLGEYELVRRISDGAQASVYEARARVSGETLALKLFKDTGDDDAEIRFKRESEVLRNLNHRNIVRYKDSFSASGEWGEQKNCLVMEYMQGQTLKERMANAPKGMTWQEAQDIIEQCVAGLAFAFEKHGVIHRDIKPSNIFILADGQVRLFDFGIATMSGSATKTGGAACMGSFDYMAPDFALADTFTPAGAPPFRGDHISDIFSMTLCFYEMIAGRLPWPKFGERPELEYLARWRSEKPKPPSHSPIIFRVIRHLTGFVDKGLDPQRQQRFQSFDEMLESLHALRPRTLKHKNKDEYELIEGLDKGGFGEVYKARRTTDGKIVAVKRLFTDRPTRRFVKEADLLKRYSHPHLVEYMDFFQNVGSTGTKQLFLVMEYLEGMPQWSLRNRIKECPAGMDRGETLELFRYYLEALQYLHENVNQIIHRDIKPGNLYAPKDTPVGAKILDLGVARDVSGTQTHGSTPGTWDYMAPEFITDNSRGTPQSDIYALGLSLYEALTGTPAFQRTSKSDQEAAAEFVARATGTKKAIINFAHPVFKDDRQIEKIIRTSTHPDPSKRYPGAAQMRADVMLALKSMGRLGNFEIEEAHDSSATSVAGETASAPVTQATMAAAPDEPAMRTWRKWVARERSRRQIKQAMTAVAALVVTVGLVSLAVIKMRHPATTATGGHATTPSPGNVAGTVPATSSKPAPVGVLPTPANLAPGVDLTSRAEPAAPRPRAPTPAVQAARTPTPPVAAAPTPTVAAAPEPTAIRAPQPATPATPPPVLQPAPVVAALAAPAVKASSQPQDTSTRDLLKELRLLRMRNIVDTSYSAFLYDASSRADNALMVISQPEYASLRNNADVVDEMKRLWHHIAANAVSRYRVSGESRFLGAARGALYAAASLHIRAGVAGYASMLREWDSFSGTSDFTQLLPFPSTDTIAPSVDAAGKPVVNPYIAGVLKSQDFAGCVSAMMPHQATVLLRSSLNKERVREAALDMALVPDSAADSGDTAQPFYLARTETTFGAMRCYRDGARADVAAKPELAALFAGTLGTESPSGSDVPYRIGNKSEAFEFCNWLSYSHGFKPVYSRRADGNNWTEDSEADGFRLPSTAEWEKAARFGFDRYPAAGMKTWKEIESDLDQNHPDKLVNFYYKTEPRPPKFDADRLYPLGMVDMCGNLGELAMRGAKLCVCGGSFKDRTAAKVTPGSVEDFNPEKAESVGFRVLLPMATPRYVRRAATGR